MMSEMSSSGVLGCKEALQRLQSCPHADSDCSSQVLANWGA